MRNYNRKCNIWGRRITVWLLLCGLLFPFIQKSEAATIIYEYKWMTTTTGLPADDQWHDYFIAWEDLDDKNKVWFTNYNWYTGSGSNNIDVGGSHWMEYKAATTLPNSTAQSFTSKECLGHMQIKYAGTDEDNENSPMYYIRVSKMSGGYSYFTSYEPSNKESSADAFTFQDMGDVFHIFVNISGKADRYLTRDGQFLETTESSSYGGGEKYRALRVYQRTFTIEEEEDDPNADVIGKVTLYEYSWVNTVEELLELASSDQWTNIMLAWEDADGYGTTNPDKVWYTKEVWFEEGSPNYENGSFWEGTANEFYYWSNDYLGSDGYGSPYEETFILPSQVGHFQLKLVDWDDDNPVHGYKNAEGKQQDSPVFHIRFDIGREKYIYVGNNGFHEDADDAEDYTMQLRLGRKDEEDLYGSFWIINNMVGEDEMITRRDNWFSVSNWTTSSYWEFPFRIYTYHPVEYDAIVKSFTIGRGATYSIDKQLIVNEGVTITVEDGGVLTVDDHLLNNGSIVVKNGGTVIVNEGGYVMAYDPDAEGKITLDGGNLIILEGAKVLCDTGDGTLLARNGAAIVNRGLLLVSRAMELRNNSYLINEANAVLVLGGIVSANRGGVGDFPISSFGDRVSNVSFAFLCSVKSKLYNYGTISVPTQANLSWDWDGSNGILNKGKKNGRW